jgi:hypothetical protein
MLPVGNSSTPYKSIAVTEIAPGDGDTIATFTVKIGSVLVRKVSLRRGRNDSIFVNYPSYKNEHGRWVSFVEVTSPALEVAVREEIHKACSEVAR